MYNDYDEIENDAIKDFEEDCMILETLFFIIKLLFFITFVSLTIYVLFKI